MDTIELHKNTFRPVHEWLQKLAITYIPGPTTPLLERFAENLINQFQKNGHFVQPEPDDETDVILTSARFGEPLGWREALLFTARRRYHLESLPTIVTLVSATPDEFKERLVYFENVLQKESPDPKDYEFPGLSPEAHKTLYEQGRRGGAILSIVRLVQTQAMSIRVILVVGEEEPIEAYTIDLVGAHPRTPGPESEYFYEDLYLRILTAASTTEITDHKVVGTPIPEGLWESLETPRAMQRAGIELGKRSFFTEMVRVANLAHVPALDEAVASQYSEGCFATWDPQINGLIATVTGSARPVEKDNLTDDELAVIVGVRKDGRGALVRHVEGKRNDSPSSEAVELFAMDEHLPTISIRSDHKPVAVPVTRSKLHGHRGVAAYDPRWIEHVMLDTPYYHYPVSCSTEAQANAIRAAFSRSEALHRPDDSRRVVFTVLPGHGIVVVEKWVAGKEPFQVMWEYMDNGILQIDNFVPQGPLTYVPDGNGMMQLRTIEI